MLHKEKLFRRRKTDLSLVTLRLVENSNIPLLTDDSKAVIELLRAWTKRAETGQLHGVCITGAIDGSQYDFECAGSYKTYPSDALGPIEVMKLHMTRKALDGN